jgi:hypothetical protein
MFARHASTFELMPLASESALFGVLTFPPPVLFAACCWIAGVLAGFILGPLLTIPFRVGLLLSKPRAGFLRPFRLWGSLRPFPEPENLL